ncbi:MAG: hypothetical protein J1E56_00185 [Ruminococcus sp.]|nr:hypothetical protein [Ruminococcus sp.]
MNNKFIDEVKKHIKSKTAKQNIEDELSSHILDKIDYYVEIGYTRKQAEEMATEDMGDPEQTAVPLNSLHNIKWYKKRENIISIILNAILIIAVCYLHTALLYDNSFLSLFSLIYSPVPFNAIHYLYIDLISLAVFVLTIVTVISARNNRNKFIAGLTAVSVFMQIIFPPYQPMFYSVAKVITSGFSGYTDSIFSYAFIEENIKTFLSIGSFVIALVLLGMCIYIFRGIYLQERGKSSKRLWTPYKIFKKILICFLSLNIVLISVSTAVAYANIDEKIAENNQMKKREIEFVVNTPIAEKGIVELREDVENEGFAPLNSTDLYANYQSHADSSYIYAYCEPDSDVGLLAFAVTITSKLVPVNRDIYLNEPRFDIFKEKMILQDFGEDEDIYDSTINMLTLWTSTLKTPEMSLTNFMNGELYQKAVSVDKTTQNGFNEPLYNESGINYEDIRFHFLLESNEYWSVTVVFTDGYLTNLQFWKK